MLCRLNLSNLQNVSNIIFGIILKQTNKKCLTVMSQPFVERCSLLGTKYEIITSYDIIDTHLSIIIYDNLHPNITYVGYYIIVP